MHCYVRDCPNGLKSLKKKKDSDLTKFFPAPEDKNLLEKWKRVIPKAENVFSLNDKLCDSHFLPSEVLWFTETKLPNGNVRRLLRDEPILRPGTIPSIFPAEKPQKENTSLPGREKQDTPKPIIKNILNTSVRDKSITPKSIVKNTNTAVKEKIETPKSNVRIRFKDPIVSSGKRHPQRVKRRSTVLDDYWTDEELNQVHNPGGASRVAAASAASAKRRKTESSGLQPIIRLVPLECLMDKTVSKNKAICKPVGTSRPSTEEIDQELKKVIEIPLLTSLKPKKSMTLRPKETVQFKPPKKNISKSKIKMMADSESLVSHNQITESAVPSEGLNEVKTETPDIEEELARMEMEEENEDVKSSDIVVLNPLGEDDSVVVKSEEEDDGYSVNEGVADPALNVGEGNEVPTIKSEDEEEQSAVEVGSNSDNELSVNSEQTLGSALPSETSNSVPTVNEQQKEVPEVPVEAEQSKDVEEQRAIEAKLVDDNAGVETENSSNADSAKEMVVEKEVEGKEAKIVEEKRHEPEVPEVQEKEKITETGKVDEADIPTDAAEGDVKAGEDHDLEAPVEAQSKKNDSQASQEIDSERMDEKDTQTEPSQETEPRRKDDESAMETESLQEVEPGRKDESAMETEQGTLQSENIDETTKPVIPGATPAAGEKMKEAVENREHCGTLVEPVGEMANTSDPPDVELEKNLSEVKEVMNGDASKTDVNRDLPETVNEADCNNVTETTDTRETETTDTRETETITSINDDTRSSKPDDIINVSDSEAIEEAEKGPTADIHQEPDQSHIVNVDLTESADQSSDNKDPPVEKSSGLQENEPDRKNDESSIETEPPQEVEPERKDDESAVETEHGVESTNESNVEDLDDDVHLEASSTNEEGTEAEGNTESEERDSNRVEQPENGDEMDIEAEVARLVSEVEETAEQTTNKKVRNEGDGGNGSNLSQRKGKQPDKESVALETSQSQEIVLQDTTNLGGITAAGVQNLFSPETIQEILKQIKLPLTTPVTFRIAPLVNTPSSSSSGRGRGRKKGMRGMRGTNRQVVPRASSSRDASHDSIDLFRHLTRTRTVFDFPTFIPDINDDIQYWKLCQVLKESFHELIETRNTKTSIGKLTLKIAINRPKKPKVHKNNGESEADSQ